MEQNKSMAAEKFEFKAEMKQLLQLIIHSLYTNPEIFLRELVSNSSDALNKVRFLKLTNPDINNADAELNIKITVNSETQEFTIEDTGIGMTKDDLTGRLGTIASSGTMEFIKQIKENNQNIDGNMIGQFGVGFYSLFMVTDEVTVETKHADKDAQAYKWISSGQDTFVIEEIEKETRGTKITFKLKDEYKDMANDYRVKNILQKYSNFVDFPVYVGDEKVNKVTALWHKRKDDITEEELNEFYKFISNDYQEPLGHLHLNIEGNINFKALLFVPKVAPPDIFKASQEKSLHLYSSKVFIQDDAKNLLPDYLKFLKGVVDTEDLPLNVSREVTQNSPVMAKISNVLTGKVLGLLEEWADKDKEKFETFYKNFGSLFKTGVNTDFSHKDRIVELLRFESTKTEPGELTSFNSYVAGMGEANDNKIYYISGNTRESVESNPNLEYFKKKDIEVILLTDPADVFTIPYINEYDGKQIISIEKAEIKKDDNNENKLDEEKSTTIIEYFKEVLGEEVEDVVESQRLVDSAVTLVVGKAGMDAHMEKMMQMLDKQFKGSKRILEINTSHNLIKNLSQMLDTEKDSPILKESVEQLYQGALLIEGYIQKPTDFVKRMTEFMEKATSK